MKRVVLLVMLSLLGLRGVSAQNFRLEIGGSINGEGFSTRFSEEATGSATPKLGYSLMASYKRYIGRSDVFYFSPLVAYKTIGYSSTTSGSPISIDYSFVDLGMAFGFEAYRYDNFLIGIEGGLMYDKAISGKYTKNGANLGRPYDGNDPDFKSSAVSTTGSILAYYRSVFFMRFSVNNIVTNISTTPYYRPWPISYTLSFGICL